MFDFKQKGFTLIELLVVIAVIGIISSLVLVSMGEARAKARDSRRKSDIDQVRRALELYYIDNGQYPLSGGAVSPNSGWTNSNHSSWDNLATDLRPYLAGLPKDPVNSSSGWAGTAGIYTYNFYSRGYGCERHWYMIVYRMEKTTTASPGVLACNGTNFNYSGTVTIGMRQK